MPRQVTYTEADLHLKEIRFTRPAKGDPVLVTLIGDVLKEDGIVARQVVKEYPLANLSNGAKTACTTALAQLLAAIKTEEGI